MTGINKPAFGIKPPRKLDLIMAEGFSRIDRKVNEIIKRAVVMQIALNVNHAARMSAVLSELRAYYPRAIISGGGGAGGGFQRGERLVIDLNQSAQFDTGWLVDKLNDDIRRQSHGAEQ